MARVERVARLNEGARSARVGEGERGSARVELSRHPFLYQP